MFDAPSCRPLSPSSLPPSLSPWRALTYLPSPDSPPPCTNSGWGICVKPCPRTGRPLGQAPGSFHQCLITERSEPWHGRGKPRQEASAPWPHVGARDQAGPRFPGGETKIRREQEGTCLVPMLGRWPRSCPGFGPGAAPGFCPLPGLTLPGRNRLRARRFLLKPKHPGGEEKHSAGWDGEGRRGSRGGPGRRGRAGFLLCQLGCAFGWVGGWRNRVSRSRWTNVSHILTESCSASNWQCSLGLSSLSVPVGGTGVVNPPWGL